MCSLLTRYYVFPDVGEQVVKLLRGRHSAGLSRRLDGRAVAEEAEAARDRLGGQAMTVPRRMIRAGRLSTERSVRGSAS